MIETFGELKQAILDIPDDKKINPKFGIEIKKNRINIVKLTVANILKDKYKATFDSYDGDAVDEDSEVRKYQLNTITVICDKSDIPKAFKDINDAIDRTDLQPIPEFIEFKDNIDEILNQYNEDPENDDLFRFGYAGDLMIKYVYGTLTVKYSSNVY